MQLRNYQLDAVNAIFAFLRDHPDPKDSPLVALPTGTGKSLVIAGIIKMIMQWWPGRRILMLVHVRELVEQNADKLKQHWPQAPLGIYSAGLNSKIGHMPITFASVQSVVKNLPVLGKQDIVFVDECHLISPDEETTYRKVIGYLQGRNEWVRFVGLSATIYRTGLGMLTQGGVFTHVCYDLTSLSAFNRLLDEGYLAPLIPMRMNTTLDVSGVKKRGGEFVASDLQKAVNKEEVTRAALEEAVVAAADRQHWLVFATGVDHVKSIVAELERLGVPARGVWAAMGNAERDDAIRAFKAGEIRALVNVGILTTGFDFPALDCIIGLRPTNSVVMHIQMLGRLTRPFYAQGFDLGTTEGRLQAIAASDKVNGLVLDCAGNVTRLGPINDPRIPKMKGAGTGDIPVKVCSACGCMCHISARVCDNCGEAFLFETKITPQASTAALVVRDEPVVELFDVQNVTYKTHVKYGHPPSLLVSYYCGVRRFQEWVCLEHHGSRILPTAHAWWKERSDQPPPMTIAEALNVKDGLRVPRQIRVWINQRYPRILSAIF